MCCRYGPKKTKKKKKMQSKTTMSYYLTPVRKAIIKKSASNKMLKRIWRKGNTCTCCWECKLVQPLWKTVRSFLKKTENKTAIWSSSSIPGYTSGKNENTNSKRYMHPNVHRSTIYNSQDMKTTQIPTKRKGGKEMWNIYTYTYHIREYYLYLESKK